MNKKILMFSMLGLFAIVLVSAAVYIYIGNTSVDIIVSEALSVGTVSVSFVGYPGETLIENIIVENEANVPLYVDLTYEEQSNDNTFVLDNDGGTCANYPDPGWRDECEKRIVFSGEGMTLNELETISWDANVISGYLPHVDVILDNGESLTFEYDKVADCGVGDYLLGELNTFDDKGIIDGGAYAWSNLPGPCGDSAFEAQYNSLADWKGIYPGAIVTKIEVEIDNWIEASNSEVSNIVINGEKVSVVTYTDDMPKTVTVNKLTTTNILVSFTINEDSQVGEFAGVVNVKRVAGPQ